MGPARRIPQAAKNIGPDPALWPKAEARLPPLELRRAPLLAAACCFALGELLSRVWHPPAILLLSTSLLVLLTLVSLRYSLRLALLPVASVWFIVGLWCAKIQPAPAQQQALATYADGLSRQVRGRITRVRELQPQQSDPTRDKEPGWWPEKETAEEAATLGLLSIDLNVESIEEVTPDISRMVPITGGVRLNVTPPAPTAATSESAAIIGRLQNLHCGDLIEAPVRLKLAERYRDPGAWQYADYLLEQGIGAHATVHASKFQLLNDDAATLVAPADLAAQWQCRAFAAQTWASSRLRNYVHSHANHQLPKILQLDQDDGAMLNAMLFGDRSELNKAQRIGFERTGSFHLFVVSGMHVALLAGIVFWLTSKLRLPEWVTTLTTLAFAFVYAVLTGFGAPVQRALFMTAVFLVARLLSRERNVLNALGAAALGVLVWSPSALFEASFQMTFLAIIAIGGIAVPLGERSFLPYSRAAARLDDKWIDATLQPRVGQFRLMLRLCSELCANVFGRVTRTFPSLAFRTLFHLLELALIGAVAEAVMVLPMAVYFHRATAFAVPTNMVSVPMIAVLVPMAVVTFCATLAGPLLAAVPSAATVLILHGITHIIGRVSSFRTADVRIPAPSLWVVALAICGWFFCCWAVRKSARWAWSVVVVLPLIAVIVLWPERATRLPDVLEVTAIDVGQGDSIFLVAPNGSTMLVDAGGPVGGVTETAEAASRFDVGEEVVSPYLWSRRFRRLDVLVLTHAHSDHMGGMAAVMRNFRPRELWVSIDPDSAAYRALLLEARDLGVTVRHLYAGDHTAWGKTDITILAPERDYTNPGIPINNDSLVMQVQYGGSSVLLEGDAEAPSERTMLAQHRVSSVTLLKIGHHGSRTSTTQEFLDAAAPRDALVSVGRGNTFGHPRGEVIERIAQAHTKLYRTDEFGLTTFLLSQDGRIRELTGASNQ